MDIPDFCELWQYMEDWLCKEQGGSQTDLAGSGPVVQILYECICH